MFNPYREMCAELSDRLQRAITSSKADNFYHEDRDSIDRANALLIQQEAEELTDERIWDLFDWLKDEWESNNEGEFPLPLFARAVLANWSTPRLRPVPVSEFPWKREGWCNADGKCWLRRKCDHGIAWRLMAPASVFEDAMQIYYAEALPAKALPSIESQP